MEFLVVMSFCYRVFLARPKCGLIFLASVKFDSSVYLHV